MVKVLDCTLRDGGYYTNWDFDKVIVNSYLEAMELLPIDYLELGYRSLSSQGYMGKYGYCPISEISDIRQRVNKKLVLMLNEKDTQPSDLRLLTTPIGGYVDMIRMAVDPQNLDRALILAEHLKNQGFEVGLNVMYMSKWLQNRSFFKNLSNMSGLVDVFSLVDSYGGVTPKEVEDIINYVKEYTDTPLGFHGHNNLEMSLINAITAIKNGVAFIDSTIQGMGRGAGNLKTELLLTYLNNAEGVDVDFNALGKVVAAFYPLHEKYEWGTNLPYMISGINSFPQKEVMDMVSNRLYSFNSIVSALENKKTKNGDNKKYPLLKDFHSRNVLIIGGGDTAVKHSEAIKEFLNQEEDFTVIYATSRNAKYYVDVNHPQCFCLAGAEAFRMERVLEDKVPNEYYCVVLPSPRVIDTEVPKSFNCKILELENISFTDAYKDSCTSIALQVAVELQAENVYIVGYDGYPDGLSQKEMDLSKENESLINSFNKDVCKQLTSLTPTLYTELSLISIYSKLK